MKAWILAGMITAATVPFAAASENEIECQLDEVRRATETRSSEAPPPAGVAARPAASVQRDSVEQAQRAAPPRRRSGKTPIPDAELIGPRIAL
ncbi:MAG: hypothetical protein J0L81_02240 [Caulobacterales bacterium]|jgi:hypothetical protein|nr:hypothetical protein [Caulobacterales bacterium]